LHENDETNKWSFVYLGQFHKGVFHGKGKKKTGQGYMLVCDFDKGKPHGQGKLYYPDKTLFFEGTY
jgi:hypothetical protein